MKRKLFAFSRRYQAGLQKYLSGGATARLALARRLGEEAVVLGLETLDLARIHEIALAALVQPGYSSTARNRMSNQAKIFFAEANLAIEETHFAAVESAGQVRQLHATLSRRTEELAASRRGLRRGIRHRKAAQQNFKKRAAQSAQLLEQSRQLQEQLRRLTRQIFSSQEDERKKMSRELHDEIAQSLLGINVRLITLKRDALANGTDLRTDLGGTQQLVEKSMQTMRRLAREFTRPPPARRRRTAKKNSAR
jgi:signal transduction histidine kinase